MDVRRCEGATGDVATAEELACCAPLRTSVLAPPLGSEPLEGLARTTGVPAPRPAPGARRAVAVGPTGALGDDRSSSVWACERFDGLLWQLVGLVTSPQERDAFLHGE